MTVLDLENREFIRKVLLNEWDPIGVRGIPEAADEYDDYVDEIFQLLTGERMSVDDLTKYLMKITTDRMGLASTADLFRRSEYAARYLLRLKTSKSLH